MASIRNENDLESNFINDVVNTSSGDYWISVRNHNLEYDFQFPLISDKLENFEKKSFLGNLESIEYGLKFQDCIFEGSVTIYNKLNYTRNITFSNCTFNKKVFIRGYEGIITFSNGCVFNEEITAENAVLKGKIRFRQCHFKCLVNFRNTTFNELADFWRCVFYKKTIFYKTDFNNIVVFSAVTFKENVLFTYSLIAKLLLLRGAKVEKGFDLSLAIISGKLGLFDFRLSNYNTQVINTEEEYEKAVSKEGDIPIKNKRETFRIIKDNLESQKNLAESLEFKTLEKQTLLNELWSDLSFSKFFDVINLGLNWLSNKNGSSYGRAFIFTLCAGWLWFYISLISTETYFIESNFKEWEFQNGVRQFIEFLNPIHKVDYLGSEVVLSTWFYVWDFIGKAFVGYGIYQFIQAFRKYK